MTTDITELAQREKFEAWVITQICISKITLEGLRTPDGYRNSALSGRDYNLMWNLWKAAGAELVEALEKAQQRIDSQREYYDGVIADGGKRIAELESRTVTVKQFDEFQICHYGATEDYAKGYIDCQNNFFKWLTAEGIKVEAE